MLLSARGCEGGKELMAVSNYHLSKEYPVIFFTV